MPDAQTAVLTIDLAAIAANYRSLVDHVAPATCAGVVKADAYGLGAAMVAPVLQREGCRHFFVATVDEGLALRQILPSVSIYILNGLPPGSAATLASADLIPVLVSFEQVEDWRKFCSTSGQPKAAALQIDTGISRLGLSQADVARLATDPRLLRGFPLVHVMSHLACGDEPDYPLNDQQRMLFKTFIERFPWPNAQKPSFGMAASAGIFLGTDFHFDLVRPGMALYGLAPTIGRQNPMRPVVRLQGKILQIRDVDLGMTVGYGASHRFEGPSRLATIGVGYADGIFRTLGNRGAVFIAGERAPVVGRISMDLMTVDVGRIPNAAAHPGAVVDIIGPEQSVDDLARDAGTIGYEILTSFGKRYQRRYISDTRRNA
jgi:alanine racemase